MLDSAHWVSLHRESLIFCSLSLKDSNFCTRNRQDNRIVALNPMKSTHSVKKKKKKDMKIPFVSLLTAIVVLTLTAEKCRQLVGENLSGRISRSRGERFTFLNCLDMSYGSVACILKEVVKIYMYYVRASHVHKVRAEATNSALEYHLSQGRSRRDAMAAATEVGNAAARRASLQAKHIMAPTVSSVWDFFETVYVGGTTCEGVVRSVGTFLGSYSGGLAGEGRFGWFGFLVGSQFGSWVGGRLGLAVYDVGIGLHYLLHLTNYRTTDSYHPISNDIPRSSS